MNQENPNRLLENPGKATAEAGLVLLEGPDGIAVTLTPHAARETGESLIRAANIASNSGAASQS